MKTIMRGLAVLGLMLGISAQAQQGIQTRHGILTNVASLMVGASGVSNVNSQVTAWRDRGMAFLPLVAATNASTANVTFLFDVSADGVNWSTTHPAIYVLTLNGTTAVRGYTRITRDTIDDIQWIRLSQITNAHTASIWVSNVTWSVFP